MLTFIFILEKKNEKIIFILASALTLLSQNTSTSFTLQATSLHNREILFFSLRGNQSGVELFFNISSGEAPLKIRIGATATQYDTKTLAVYGHR